MKVSMSHMYQTYSKKLQESDQVFCDYEKLVAQHEREYIKPFDHAKIICESVAKNSGHNFLFTHRGTSANDYLKDAGMDNYFTECITSEYGFKRKPAPDAIYYLLEKYNLNLLETVMIGDRDIDILSGKNAGILTCYCDKDQTRKPEYVDYSFTSLELFQKFLIENNSI